MTGPRSSKGFIFTLLVVVLFLLVLLTVRAWLKGQQAQEELNGVRIRAGVLAGFISSADAEAERMTGISGTRAAYYSAFYASRNRTPLDDAPSGIGEIAWNGTLDGRATYLCSGSTCRFTSQMENMTMSQWLGALSSSASRRGFALAWGGGTMSATQEDYYSVGVGSSLWLRVDDVNGAVSFNRTLGSEAHVNITGFEDPLFTLSLGAAKRRYIAPWPYPDGYEFVRRVAQGSVGDNGWTYGRATTIPSCCTITSCSDGTLTNPEDANTTLVVDDIRPVAASCPTQVNSAFRGVLSNLGNTSVASLTVPYMYGFGSGNNITLLVPDATPVLLNNDGSRHEVLDVERMRAMAQGAQYYRPAPDAGPDYLSRLENRSAPSPYGIESLMNYSSVGPADVNRSWVDYYFLNGTSCSSIICFKIKGSPNCEDNSTCDSTSRVHFRLDNMVVLGRTHLQNYGVENLTYPNN